MEITDTTLFNSTFTNRVNLKTEPKLIHTNIEQVSEVNAFK